MASNHSNEHPGLQQHSIGEHYPWGIKRIGEKGYQPWNLITGEEGPIFFFEASPFKLKFSRSRRRYSHYQAELWIETRTK